MPSPLSVGSPAVRVLTAASVMAMSSRACISPTARVRSAAWVWTCSLTSKGAASRRDARKSPSRAAKYADKLPSSASSRDAPPNHAAAISWQLFSAAQALPVSAAHSAMHANAAPNAFFMYCLLKMIPDVFLSAHGLAQEGQQILRVSPL